MVKPGSPEYIQREADRAARRNGGHATPAQIAAARTHDYNDGARKHNAEMIRTGRPDMIIPLRAGREW